MARRISKAHPQEESLAVGTNFKVGERLGGGKPYYYFGLTKKFLKFVRFIW